MDKAAVKDLFPYALIGCLIGLGVTELDSFVSVATAGAIGAVLGAAVGVAVLRSDESSRRLGLSEPSGRSTLLKREGLAKPEAGAFNSFDNAPPVTNAQRVFALYPPKEDSEGTQKVDRHEV